MKGGDPRRRPDFAGEIEVRRRALAHAGNDAGEAVLGVDMAANDIDEVDQPAARQPSGDGRALGFVDAALGILVAHHARADDEIRADAGADRAQNLLAEAQAVVERAAILVIAPVGQRRPELVDEMAIGLDLQPVESSRLHPLRRIGVGGHHPGDVEILHGFRKRPMRRLAHVARGQHRQPIVLGPARAPAEMGDLDHHRRAVTMHLVDQRLQPADRLVPVKQNVAERLRTVRRNHRRAADHRQADAALGFLDVIGAIALLRHPVVGVGGFMRGGHQTISDRQRL